MTALAVALPLAYSLGSLLGRERSDIAAMERESTGLDGASYAAAAIARLRDLRADGHLRRSFDLRKRLAVEDALTRLYDFDSGAGRALGLDKRLKRLQAAWAQVPASGATGPALDAAIAAALDVARTIDERSALRGDSGPAAADLLDAFAVQLPAVSDRGDQARDLVYSYRARAAGPGIAAVALGVDIFTSQANRALAVALADLQRASALDPGNAAALAALERTDQAWQRFEALSDVVVRDPISAARNLRAFESAGDALFPRIDAATAAAGQAARRALQIRLRRERTAMARLAFGALAATALVVLAGLLLARAVRERYRRDLERARAEAQRLRLEAEHRRTRELLALTEARFEAIFERAAVGVAILDMSGTIVRTNAALDAMMPGATPAGVGAARPDFERLRSGEIGAYAVEFKGTLSGKPRWIEADVSLVRDEAERPLFAVAMVKDVSERHEHAERLRWEATHDSLVDLPNRAALLAHLQAAFVDRTVIPHYSAVAFVDLDGFEAINDRLGHAAGDRVLKLAARRLAATTDFGDFIARFGGDEFVVVLERRRDPDEVTSVAKRIVDALAGPFRIDDREVFLRASAGLVIVETPYDAVDELVRDAQVATAAAKSMDLGHVAVFDASMRERARRAHQLGEQLRRALERDQLHLAYQPIVELATQRVASFEVLLRWDHPELGLVSPAEFVPIAEDAGLIVPIGRWVFERACAQLAAWHALGGDVATVRLSVNAAVQEIFQSDYCDYVERTVARHGIAPGDITLEITESAILRTDRTSSETLDRLRRAGLRLAVDDFGTGYSSLRYIQAFPFDYLKIDGSFVRGKGGELASKPIIAMIVALGRAIGLSVIAEGVETEGQAEALRKLGCASGQGFLFGRPTSASAVPAIVSRRLRAVAR